MSTIDSTKRRLVDLLRDIEAGKIQLPDFQRGWVWDDEHNASGIQRSMQGWTFLTRGTMLTLYSEDGLPIE